MISYQVNKVEMNILSAILNKETYHSQCAANVLIVSVYNYVLLLTIKY